MFKWLKNLFKKEVKVTHVETTKGFMLVDDLEKKEGVMENDKENTKWVEYWHDGELVHRSVHVILKPQAVAQLQIGSF